MSFHRHLRRRILLVLPLAVLAILAFTYFSNSPNITTLWGEIVKARLGKDSALRYPPAPTEYCVLLAAVYSTPDEASLRNAVRETWGQYLNEASKSKLLFFMRPPDDEEKGSVAKEHETHRDIVQLKITDTFKNQVVRSISIFNWITKSRIKVKYLLRTDAKAFVNIQKLVNLIHGINSERYLLGRATVNTKPERDQSSPWYASKEDYPADEYPLYLQSFGYLMTGNLIQPMLHIDSTKKRFWIEDVYITGILANELRVPIINSDVFTNSKPQDKCDYLKYVLCSCSATYEDMKEFYRRVELPDESCHA